MIKYLSTVVLVYVWAGLEKWENICSLVVSHFHHRWRGGAEWEKQWEGVPRFLYCLFDQYGVRSTSSDL